MKERLVSKPIRPVFAAAGDPPGPVADEFLAVGEPLFPRQFVWNGEEHIVAEVIERWKEYSHPGATMPERYLKRHWYRIRTAAGQEMKIYFERQARKARSKQRWWLYSVFEPA